jgi:NAD(P)-dependent dehydrogenase (short-subunit alcohol dehydrogenase family)
MQTIERVFGGGVAVITGAGSGIGEGLAKLAARIGMRVVLADISVADLDRVSADIKNSGGEALAVPTDVAQPEALERLAARTHEQFGDVRLLINNAGIEAIGFSWELSAQQWQRALTINVHGVVHGVRAFAPRMLAAGQPAWIANTSSTGALNMLPLQSAYVMGKHAVQSFTECLALEMQLKKAPITVSAIVPGPVNSQMFAAPETARADADPDVAAHLELMRAYLARQGIAPDEAARRIFAGLAAREFWISTHPDISAEVARRRANYLAELAPPRMPPLRAAQINQSE